MSSPEGRDRQGQFCGDASRVMNGRRVAAHVTTPVCLTLIDTPMLLLMQSLAATTVGNGAVGSGPPTAGMAAAGGVTGAPAAASAASRDTSFDRGGRTRQLGFWSPSTITALENATIGAVWAWATSLDLLDLDQASGTSWISRGLVKIQKVEEAWSRTQYYQGCGRSVRSV